VGAPAPWGINEWAWRSAIAEQARAVASAVRDWPIVGACFTVKIVFYLAPPSWERPDLDNLAKPVLDTVFLPNNPQVRDRSLTGALFEVDDSRIMQLTVRS
jgi:Holliday junction resolvase RusA-like endonuclease